MKNLNNLSSYQDPEGTLKDRLAPRTDMRKDMFNWDWVKGLTVLDIGCNNGYFTREAMKHGAARAVGVDKSDAILGARELAKEEGVDAEFWQTNLDSPEFRRYCPRFDVVFLLSVITHVRDKEEFLDWLDDRIKYRLIFESNHGEPNKKHIELVRKHIYFENCQYLGPSDIPEKPHYMWLLTKHPLEKKYPSISLLPIEFVPIDKIVDIPEDYVTDQKNQYDLKSDKFKALMADIKERGIRDPLVVRQKRDHLFYSVQGAHRYWAAKLLGYKDVPCRVMR